ncbi:MAG: molybdopterin synthase sulfur carrier subunit [Minwuia thermotolerans]|nr:MAG: molybdopterin synthase sulfur carrier subunit [Minwuia thermotolerans]
MKLLYFAWVRERTGIHEETWSLPEGVTTVRGLIGALSERSPGFAHAFADLKQIRTAVNQETAKLDDPVSDADEVAFFPPMTGG